jgi:hypothetical protein
VQLASFQFSRRRWRWCALLFATAAFASTFVRHALEIYNQAETGLIITINDPFIGDLPLIINISDNVLLESKVALLY